MRGIIFFLVFFAALTGYAQNFSLKKEKFLGLNDSIAGSKLQEDLTQIRKFVLEVHPDPFVYITKEAWDTTYLKLLNDFKENHTLYDFFHKTSLWTNQLKDSHLGFDLENIYYQYNLDQSWCDFQLARINDKFYSYYFSGNVVPFGCEIIKINHIPIDSLYISSLAFSIQEGDSYEAKKRYATSLLNPIFNFKFANEFTDNNIPIQYVNWDGDTLFCFAQSKKEKEIHDVRDTKTKVKSNELEYEIIERDNIGILTINSFLPANISDFKDTLSKFFELIEQYSISKILIDIRNNQGGYFECVNYLYNFIDTTDQIREKRFVSKRSKYDRLSKSNKITMWLYFKFGKFIKHSKKTRDDYSFYLLPYGSSQTILESYDYDSKHQENKYFGTCYLAMNGQSISASVDCASWFKQSKRGLILGEECMGPITGTCGNPVAVTLKNSKVSFISSSMRSYSGNAFEIFSEPIQPDVLIKYNLHNFRYKTDPILEYVKKNN